MMNSDNRDFPFDNLRTLMVLFIVLLHAVCAYAFGTPWWHAQDAKSPVFDIILISIDTFALPVLFFISGVFSSSSIDRHGIGGFVRTKFKRLGIPLLALSAFYLPTMVYVGYARRADSPTGFFDYWLHWISTSMDWSFTLITNMEQGARYADSFSPHHLWFISLLLFFFLGHAGWRRLFGTQRSRLSRTHLILIAWGAIFAGFAAINLLTHDWAWARFGPFILLQPTRLPVYLGMFVFGINARPHMDKKLPFPAPTWIWFIVFLVALGSLVALSRKFMLTPGPAPLQDALVHGLLRSVLSVAGAALFINMGKRFMTKPSALRQSLAASSYDIYLWHMPLVVFVQAALVGFGIPLAGKALLAFLVPSLICWGVSRTTTRTGQWLPSALLAALFAGFCLAT